MAHYRIITVRDDLDEAGILALATASDLKVAQQYESNDTSKLFTAVSTSVLFEDNLVGVANLEFNAVTNQFTSTKSNGTVDVFDISAYLDDTNAARLVSGALDGVTGVATFNRDDASTFTVDFSSFLADLNYKGLIVDDVETAGTFTYTDGESGSTPVVVDVKVIPNVEVNYVVLVDTSGNSNNIKLTNNNGVLETETV